MGIFDRIQLLERVHTLILHKNTGTPKEFAARLNISERTLYRIIEELKDRDAIIEYCPIKGSYVYLNEVVIKVQFRVTTQENKIIIGGVFNWEAFQNMCQVHFSSYPSKT